MLSRRRISAGLVTTLTLAGVLFCQLGIAESEIRHGVVWYTDAPDSVVDLGVARYHVGVTGRTLPRDKIEIKTRNPDFQWFVYTSGTDNWVPPYATLEHELLVARSTAGGWNIEDAYLHYWDDTEIVLEGDTVLVPGWGGGSATNPADARLPVYHKNLSRRVANFSTPHTHQAYKEILCELAFDRPFEGSNIYPDGIFLDNSAYRLYNHGIILSGGHVREAPGHPRITDSAFQDWHWTQNISPLLIAFKDTLETSATWSRDGKRKYVMNNVANVWDDSYVSLDVTDVVYMEFQYNPVRNFGMNMIDEAYRRDTLAASGGIALFYSATTGSRAVGGHVYSYADIIIGNLAWYLTTRTDNSIFFEFANSTPHVAGWDTLTWRGILDVVNQEMGQPIGGPYTLAQGTDPLGNEYVVKARDYEGGMTVIRNRGQWNQGIEPQTAVTVNLPTSMIPLNADGYPGAQTEHVSLRNGQAAIFLHGPVAVSLLSFTAEWQGGNAVVRWQVGTASGDHAGFRVHRENADGDRIQISPGVLSGQSDYLFMDDDPVPEARYWLAELTRSGTVNWHGPVTLPPSASRTPTTLRLTQNRPNPCRGATAIAFEVKTDGPARLTVFDVNGREVTRLFDGHAAIGPHEVSWDGRTSQGARVSPGIYFYRLETPSGTLTRKLTLLP